MKTDKKIFKSASILGGAILSTALVASPVSGADLLAYNNLGSGAELRSHLIDLNLNQNNIDGTSTYKFGELKCGEGKCGEGKCGEDKKAEKKAESKGDKEKKKAEKKEAKSEDSKTKEAKCGEGKCG